ncbi:MAG: hypothetical protein AB7I18_10590 [Candidatus Berkiella sp.]
MKTLNLENCQQISGGDAAVSVTANVPTENTAAFVNLLGLLLTNQLDAKTLAAYLDNDAANFNDMPIETITFGNYVITRT